MDNSDARDTGPQVPETGEWGERPPSDPAARLDSAEIHDLGRVAQRLPAEAMWSLLVSLANRDDLDPLDASWAQLAVRLDKYLRVNGPFYFVVSDGHAMAYWSREYAEERALPASSRLYIVELRMVEGRWQAAITLDTTWRELDG